MAKGQKRKSEQTKESEAPTEISKELQNSTNKWSKLNSKLVANNKRKEMVDTMSTNINKTGTWQEIPQTNDGKLLKANLVANKNKTKNNNAVSLGS